MSDPRDPSLAPSASSLALANLLSKVLEFPTRSDALRFLSATKKGKYGITPKQRQSLCVLAGLEEDWVQCNQKVDDNVKDLAALICGELYDPFHFYTRTLLKAKESRTNNQEATVPLKWDKRKKFWAAWNDMKQYSWLPPRLSTYDATVHFLQEGSGTGVHVGNGVILTCAHVVDARDDIDEDVPNRVGRVKAVMFPSGHVFLAECVAVCETADGIFDTAALRITSAVHTHTDTADITLIAENQWETLNLLSFLPVAPLASSDAEPSSASSNLPLLFCIGNPSSIDLEALSPSRCTVEFSPATWHVSVGHLLNSSPSPTNPSHSTERGLLHHSCWTYWGHSGAPLFNESGEIVGLHCAWDVDSGVRQGQRLETLKDTLNKITGKKEESSSISTSTIATINQRIKKRKTGKRKIEDTMIVDLT